ncbi:uncharacterized protein E0L32_008029 [Thyridium curvatum]|uniref:RRM domain-containing protein n=1 Tax=Thyridium curvatum TaxID=1093900 RepID=A0A507AMD3_9PEZI|nr:uncharacterized protein E0L32_008029 [Thyridium curvatum]TPX10992.1 hypothetical protein E0L32_008029 [Thyridium curvatum]
MAPELRKKKAQAVPAKKEEQEDAAQKKTKAVAAGKRKAPEQASPVAAKKQKSVSDKATSKKAVNGSTTSTKKEVKKSSAKKAAAPADKTEDQEEEEDEQTKALARVLDDDSDSDDAEDEGFSPGQDVGRIPEVKDKVKKGALLKHAGGDKEESGVVYISRIPHGFYEHEMRAYLSQFGEITRLRLSRNKKTGASRHYAFVEFAEASTADIVAKTMDNYLLFGHLLKCKVVAPGQVHESLFKGANRRFKKVPWNKMAGRQLEQAQTETAWGKKIDKEAKRRASRADKLKALGYEYEAPQLKAAAEAVKDTPAPAAALENGDATEAPEAIEAPPAAEEAQKDEEEEEEAVAAAPKTKAKPAAKAKKGAKGKKVKA